MYKFSIIGGNSSIARNFLKYLEDKDVNVKAYDIQSSQADGFDNYRKIDLMSVTDIESIDFDCDAVFVFSGLNGAERSNIDAQSFIDINEKVLINILNAVAGKKAHCRIVYPSSRLVYKDMAKPLSEEDELSPKSIYALNKFFAEKSINIFSQMYGVNYTIFRIAIPFGVLNENSSSYGIVGKLMEQARNGKINLFGDGSSVRTFTHIADICRVLYEGSISEKTLNGVFNIGGHSYSMLSLARAICDRSDCKIEFTDWPQNLLSVEVKNGKLDSSKIDGILDMKYKDILSCI